jgi:hypothetical protein
MSGFYSAMSDLELVGHVSGIPDPSELSQALAGRVKLLAEEREELQQELAKTKQALMALELGIAQDKLDGFMEVTQRTLGN